MLAIDAQRYNAIHTLKRCLGLLAVTFARSPYRSHFALRGRHRWQRWCQVRSPIPIQENVSSDHDPIVRHLSTSSVVVVLVDILCRGRPLRPFCPKLLQGRPVMETLTRASSSSSSTTTSTGVFLKKKKKKGKRPVTTFDGRALITRGWRLIRHKAAIVTYDTRPLLSHAIQGR
jgi:hypothetical protein